MNNRISLVLLERAGTDKLEPLWKQVYVWSDDLTLNGKSVIIAGEPGNSIVTIGDKSWSEASKELIMDVGLATHSGSVKS